MQRYFAKSINDGIAYFNDDDSHHLLNVMRAKIDERIEVAFQNELYLGQIICLKPLQVKIISKLDDESELKNDVTLFYCLVKGDKLDLVIQKATELGVKHIVLLTSKRTIVDFKKDDINKKLKRYQQIILNAAQQSHRLCIPTIEGVYKLDKIDKTMLKRHNFIAFEKQKGQTKHTLDLFNDIKLNESVSILIGPEGGFEDEEVELMNRLGFVNISLGSRILRSETAAIACLGQLGLILESKQ